MKLSIRVNAADRTRVLSVNTNVGGLPPNDEADGGSRPQPRLPFSPLLLQNTPSPLPTPALLSTQRELRWSANTTRAPDGGAEFSDLFH